MARVKPSLINISGKLDKFVIVDSPTYGKYMRRVVKEGSKKNEPALKFQYSRNKVLNKLAGEINDVVKIYGENIKSSKFYSAILSRFRKEMKNDRPLLLRQLKGMEINEKYPRAKLGDCTVTTKQIKNRLRIQIQPEIHPNPGEYKANCYHYELSLISWPKGNKKPNAQLKTSEWIYLNDKLPVVAFEYTLSSNVVHWLICLRQKLGVNEKIIDTMVADGMQIMDAGTRNKRTLTD